MSEEKFPVRNSCWTIWKLYPSNTWYWSYNDRSNEYRDLGNSENLVRCNQSNLKYRDFLLHSSI